MKKIIDNETVHKNKKLKAIPDLTEGETKKFNKKIFVKEDDSLCWEWRGKPTKQGYGVFVIKGKPFLSHRVAYTLFVGNIPTGMLVCHHCDNRICCNPNHLFLGTTKDNYDDMIKKGRWPHNNKLREWGVKNKELLARGERHGMTSLDNDMVLQIRKFSEGKKNSCKIYDELSAIYNVSPTAVRRIIRRQTWKHI